MQHLFRIMILYISMSNVRKISKMGKLIHSGKYKVNFLIRSQHYKSVVRPEEKPCAYLNALVCPR